MKQAVKVLRSARNLRLNDYYYKMLQIVAKKADPAQIEEKNWRGRFSHIILPLFSGGLQQESSDSLHGSGLPGRADENTRKVALMAKIARNVLKISFFFITYWPVSAFDDHSQLNVTAKIEIAGNRQSGS